MKAVFPLGKAPILVIEPETSSPNQKPVVVAETRLVLQYIADNYSHGIWTPIPEDNTRSGYFQEFAGMTLLAKVDSVMYLDSIPPCLPFIIRLIFGTFCNYVASLRNKDLDGPSELIEIALSEEKSWLARMEDGLADFLLSFPMDFSQQRACFDGKNAPKVTEWLDRVHERSAYKRAIEKGDSYDLVTFDV